MEISCYVSLYAQSGVPVSLIFIRIEAAAGYCTDCDRLILGRSSPGSSADPFRQARCAAVVLETVTVECRRTPIF